MKKLLAIFVGATLIFGVVSFTPAAKSKFETIAGPLAEGENEGNAPLDGPLSDKISQGEVQKEIAAGRGNKPLRDLPNSVDKNIRVKREMLSPKSSAPTQTTAGPIQSTVSGGKTLTLVTAGFAGMSLYSGGDGYPPDTTGDVGTQQYVQAVNTSVAIYNKSNGSQLSIQDFNSFMIAAGAAISSPCATQNYGDPVVHYDTNAKKWIVMDFAFSSQYVPSYFCIAVSDTDDAMGTWHSYTILASSTQLADYPKMAITPSGIIISANMFTNGISYAGAKVWVLDPTSLYSGTNLKFFVYTLGNKYFSLMPANIRFPDLLNANSISSSKAGFLLSDYGLSSAVRVFQFTPPNFLNTSANKMVNYTVSVPSFSKFTNQIPQKGGENVDALGDRLMYGAEVDDATASIYVSRTVVGSNSTAGIRWIQLPLNTISASTPSATFKTAIASTFSPIDGSYRWMPSLAINSKKELAIGYSISNPTSSYPSIAAVGRTAPTIGASLDVAEGNLKTGGGSQVGGTSAGYHRWGDYSKMVVDPVDKCTFWYTTEYYSVQGGNTWNTWISPFKLTSCP